jgi:hypothetical protein
VDLGAGDLMAETLIYRDIDVRALDDFHDGESGLSVDAERIWLRLLVDRELSTVVPGLVLGGKAKISERCRMKPAKFSAAWAELERDGKVRADWSVGVVVLPAAPTLDVHDPRGTNKVVEWGKFFVRQAPKSKLVDELREAWRARLGAKGKGWLEAFDSLSRGTYRKATSPLPPNDSPNRSPNISPNGSPSGSPNVSPNGSGAFSQESGVRSQEGLLSLARDTHAHADATRTTGLEADVDGATTRHDGGARGGGGARTWTGADLDEAWRSTYRRPTGDTLQLAQLAGLVREAAELRGEQPAQLAQRFLDEFKAMLAEWKARNAHHGTPQVSDAVKHFGKVLDRLEADEDDDEQPDNPAFRRFKPVVRPAKVPA